MQNHLTIHKISPMLFLREILVSRSIRPIGLWGYSWSVCKSGLLRSMLATLFISCKISSLTLLKKNTLNSGNKMGGCLEGFFARLFE